MSQFDPSYYRGHLSGHECIELSGHLPFALGNALKYLWRAGEKDTPGSNLGKALWYVTYEIDRRYKTTPVSRRRPLPPQYKAAVPEVLDAEPHGWRRDVFALILDFPEYEPTLQSLILARDIISKVAADVG